MCPESAYHDYLGPVCNDNLHPVFVTFKVEDDFVVGEKARRRISRFDV